MKAPSKAEADIVERLHAGYRDPEHGVVVVSPRLLVAAAREIEQQRALINRAVQVLAWTPAGHDGDDPHRVSADYMTRAQCADDALSILTGRAEARDD